MQKLLNRRPGSMGRGLIGLYPQECHYSYAPPPKDLRGFGAKLQEIKP